jgi:putative pyruvate formate lyase activating enzyme
MLSEKQFKERIEKIREILASCTLCPRHCRVDRTRGQRGFCNLLDSAVMNCAMPHFGEEPPLSGTSGSGTIFFSSCNLQCSYCQNFQIIHQVRGKALDAGALPIIVEALGIARRDGLHLPLVYNCGGYENLETICLLDGIVDIYLPDFKYGSDSCAFSLSGVQDYVVHALDSLREMVRQTGDTLIPEEDVAQRGTLIRHLVLPGQLENSRLVLNLIKTHLSNAVPLSIMSQYTPTPAMKDISPLNRRITAEEYESVVDYALDLGFEHLFIQEVDDRDLTPDFEQDVPFHWD